MKAYQLYCKTGRRVAVALCLMMLSTAHAASAAEHPEERSLGFYNLHTEERLRLVYSKNGQLQSNSIKRFSHLLRDHRRDETLIINGQLFDLLYKLREKVGSSADYHVISGYRSPETNQQLASAGRKVATRSQHILGHAIDIRLPGVALDVLHRAAVELKLGGVGLYRKNDFIHVDVGPVRYW